HVRPGRQRRFHSAGQLLLPVLHTLVVVQRPAFESNVIAEQAFGRHRVSLAVALEQRKVIMDQLREERGHAPPGEDGVVLGHSELKGLRVSPVDVKTNERGAPPIKLLSLLLFKPRREPHVLYSGG